ncbi:MAG: NYN domain-containing protein [Candidatus Korarchaeum sp.]
MRVLKGVKRRKIKQLAVIVDGPNMLRKELGIDLEEIRKLAEREGRLRVAAVVLDRKAPEKLVEAVTNAGFKPLISTGKVEVDFSIACMEAIYDEKIDMLVIAARSAAYMPLVHKAKESGKEVMVIGAEPGFSTALKKACDEYVLLPSPSSQNLGELEGDDEGGDGDDQSS